MQEGCGWRLQTATGELKRTSHEAIVAHHIKCGVCSILTMVYASTPLSSSLSFLRPNVYASGARVC